MDLHLDELVGLLQSGFVGLSHGPEHLEAVVVAAVVVEPLRGLADPEAEHQQDYYKEEVLEVKLIFYLLMMPVKQGQVDVD